MSLEDDLAGMTNQEFSVVVKDHILVPQAGIRIVPGGTPPASDSVAHLQVLDAPNHRVFYVPLNRVALNALAGEIVFALAQSEESDVQDAEES